MEPDAPACRLWLMRPLIGLAAAILLAGLGLVTPGARVAACSCMEMTPRQAFDAADVVFVGSAVDVADPGGHDQFEPLFFRFVVEEARKGLGVLDRELVVRTERDGAMCGASFELGTRYVVHADNFDGELSSSLCSGNETLGAGLSPGSGGASAPAADGGLPLPALLTGIAVLALAAGSGYIFLRR